MVILAILCFSIVNPGDPKYPILASAPRRNVQSRHGGCHLVACTRYVILQETRFKIGPREHTKFLKKRVFWGTPRN